jgi:acylphosphatase
MSSASDTAVHLRIEGRVQGVAYRDWATREALNLGLRGWVRNRRDGSVEALLIGPQAAIDAMIQACWQGPRLASVTAITPSPATDDGSSGFRERPTE